MSLPLFWSSSFAITLFLWHGWNFKDKKNILLPILILASVTQRAALAQAPQQCSWSPGFQSVSQQRLDRKYWGRSLDVPLVSLKRLRRRGSLQDWSKRKLKLTTFFLFLLSTSRTVLFSFWTNSWQWRCFQPLIYSIAFLECNDEACLLIRKEKKNTFLEQTVLGLSVEIDWGDGRATF